MENTQITKQKIVFALLLIALPTILLACSGAMPTNAPSEGAENIVTLTSQTSPTEAIPTLTLSPSLSPVPATPIPATGIAPAATTFSLPAPTRINFAPGATYGTALGSIKPGEMQNFVLEALQGQPMLVSVSSPANDVTMSIIAESGTTLLPASRNWSNWQGSLPASQDYFIQVIGGASEQDYSLWVSIPNRIQFAPGTTSATVSGKTVEGYIASYVVAAQGGQTMDIQLMPNPRWLL
jgi:hypothetical protein